MDEVASQMKKKTKNLPDRILICDLSESNSIGDCHRYGDFKQYYSFHPTSERISRVPTGFFIDIWEKIGRPLDFFMLDIGCNEGNLTIEMKELAQAELPGVKCHMLGIDLNSFLIRKAASKTSTDSSITFRTINIATDGLNEIKSYMIDESITHFALISCFSITMWIHVNHGDAGLKKFINDCSLLSSSTILIEPQTWVSYRKAMTRCRRLGIEELPHYYDLRIRDIRSFLISDLCDEKGYRQFINIAESEWKRQLMIFQK